LRFRPPAAAAPERAGFGALRWLSALPALDADCLLDRPSRSTADAFRAAVRTAATLRLLFPAALLIVRVAISVSSVVPET
jgi:hypothetical protein